MAWVYLKLCFVWGFAKESVFSGVQKRVSN